MYLHVGGGKYIRQERLIGIFDFDTATVAVRTRHFLQQKQQNGEIEMLDSDIPKSFLLVDEDQPDRRKKRKKEKSLVLFSKVSSGVIAARTESFEKDME